MENEAPFHVFKIKTQGPNAYFLQWHLPMGLDTQEAEAGGLLELEASQGKTVNTLSQKQCEGHIK